MRLIAIFVFAVGLALAGGGTYYASKFFSAYEGALNIREPTIETVRIIVARVDIPYGRRIDGKEVRWARWPKKSVPEGAFTDNERLFGLQNRPRWAKEKIRAGEPILNVAITDFDKPLNRIVLNEGKRAFSFPISATSGVAGFVQPGARVDILITRRKSGKMISEVFMQDVLVIAVDQRASSGVNKARVGRIATVEVTPIDAQKLELAQAHGKLSMTLRGENEPIRSAEEVQAVTTEDLFGEEKQPVIEKQVKEKPRTIKIRRGGNVVEVPID